jgi:hypothetical protein
MKPRSCKNKGGRLQKWFCKELSSITGYPFGKDMAISSRPSGQTGVDIVMNPEVRKIFPFSVECKNVESWSVTSWMEQAIANQEKGTEWMLVCKKNGIDPVVVMDAKAFFRFYSKLIQVMGLKNKCGKFIRTRVL